MLEFGAHDPLYFPFNSYKAKIDLEMRNTYVLSFTHLKDQFDADKALHLLQRVASLVKPILRKRGWVIPVLSEFYPENPNLYGLNENKGQQILLRLRPPNSKVILLPEDQVVQTMLHELTHNVYSDHDDNFYRYLDDLRLEYKGLEWSGWDGEGFLSVGHLLGINDLSTHLPPQVGRLKGLEGAENRAKAARLANSAAPIGAQNRKAIVAARESAARAADKRLRDSKACASGEEAQREVEKAAKQSITSKPTETNISFSRNPGPSKVTSDLRPVPKSSKSRLLTGNLGLAEPVKVRQNSAILPPLKVSPPASSKANNPGKKAESEAKEPTEQAAGQSLRSTKECASEEEAQQEAKKAGVEDVTYKPQDEIISCHSSGKIKDSPSNSHLAGSSRNLQSELRSVPKTYRSRLLTGNFGLAKQLKIGQNPTASPLLIKTPPAGSKTNESGQKAVSEAKESAEQTMEQSLQRIEACTSVHEEKMAALEDDSSKVKDFALRSLVGSSRNSQAMLRPVSKALKSRLLSANLGPPEQVKVRHKSTITKASNERTLARDTTDAYIGINHITRFFVTRRLMRFVTMKL
ncbi:DNA-dependent metalloprotease WSS1 [Psilocybe cubensis]|uniref:DNA-dependent metalloprotease WSS1 n=2 Tax=Psilocybe cubensis TaxID=181762 RepID=A0ACB8HEY3_PSICU|nr:DNA-dependent metalloprotease WSS1 [Psilocybe cubensis]KAH9486391.1 DNA-dependent metalloprotease WSS1 [Psilocybe cubensis]